MDKKITNNIMTEILLELTLAMGKESEFNAIIKNVLPLWMRRLNCTLGAVIEFIDNRYEYIRIVPGFLKNDEIPKQILVAIDSTFELYAEMIVDEKYYYVFNLGVDRYFYFERKLKMSLEYCNEIYPITQFFAKCLENAKAKSARLLAEKELNKERRLLRAVIDRLPDAIYLKNKNLQKTLTNEADLLNTGYAHPSEILHKTDEEIYPEFAFEDSKRIEEEILLTGKPIINRVEELRNKNNRTGWLLTSKFPFYDEDGNIEGILGIGKDITEQKVIQEKIHRLSLVASQTTNSVIITNLDGKIEWVNDGFIRSTGYTLDEVKGKKPGSFLQGPKSDPDIVREMSRSLKNRESFDVELINYTKNGDEYAIQISCNPLKDNDGNVTGFMAIETDISDKKIREQELVEAKQVAERSKDAEKAFLANMSHEIRTPLNAIIGMTSLLKETNLDMEQEEYVGYLNNSSQFLLRLISDILDLSKIEAGKIQVNIKPFELRDLLQGLYNNFSLKAQEKEIGFLLDSPDLLPPIVKSDDVIISQILNNLISNAIKFTEVGHVKVSAKLLDINGQNNIEFIVKDTGNGISKEDQELLFEKFNQVGEQKSLNTGSGLGLCITKELIELLNGEMNLKSAQGVGTLFCVRIPIEICNDEEIIKSKHKIIFPKLEKRKILIAEDNVMNQKYISRLMEKMEIDFDLVDNGKQAVEFAFKNEYSDILMDIQMPVMDGYQATKEIRNVDNCNQNTRIIALTASALKEDRDKAFELGFTDYLSKPFNPEQLKEKLDFKSH